MCVSYELGWTIYNRLDKYNYPNEFVLEMYTNFFIL